VTFSSLLPRKRRNERCRRAKCHPRIAQPQGKS
jgi:hypothetical protein